MLLQLLTELRPEQGEIYKDYLLVNDLRCLISLSGLTHSSCKILSINNVTTPFNGPEGPLCFNGKFTASYYLDFTHLHHEFASKEQESLFSFTTLCVAHEHKGTRLQSVDSDLAEYAKKMAMVDDTLTIIFADHGNTYAHYTHAVMEGRFEQFHPSMFMIVPEGVKKRLGGEIMSNLRANQYKLFTLLDVRKALVRIPTTPKPDGIFRLISNQRTCNDLDLRLPNLCVCEGWDVETKNDTNQFALLHFAAGELNNKIQLHQQELRSKGIVPKCKMLVPKTFFNVRERNNGGTLITSIDFTTFSGNGASTDHDVFHVEVQSEINQQLSSRNMKLLNFDRISKYGPYRACADQGIDMRLCVCDVTKDNQPGQLKITDLVAKEIGFEYPRLADTVDVSIIKNSRLSHCIYLRKISYPEVTSSDKESLYSITYEVANICRMIVKVELQVGLENMKTSTPGPFEKKIGSFSTVYLMTAVRDVPYWDSKVSSEKLKAEPILD